MKQFLYFEALWNEHGTFGALADISSMHTTTGIPDGIGGFLEPNQFLGIAYMIANMELTVLSFTTTHPDRYSVIRTDMDESISRMTASLSAQELSDVQEHVIKIIKDNPNCCYF